MEGKVANQISSSFSFCFIISDISFETLSVISSIFFFIELISSLDMETPFSIIRTLSIYRFRTARSFDFCCSHSNATCLIIFWRVSFVVLRYYHGESVPTLEFEFWPYSCQFEDSGSNRSIWVPLPQKADSTLKRMQTQQTAGSNGVTK